jgi:hypothetical protein
VLKIQNIFIVKNQKRNGKNKTSVGQVMSTLLCYLSKIIFSVASNDDKATEQTNSSHYITSNWARTTHTCEILKLQNMDEDRCYVHLYFYDKLSSLKPSDMSDPSVRHFQGIRLGCIKRDPEYGFTPLFIFLSTQSVVT